MIDMEEFSKQMAEVGEALKEREQLKKQRGWRDQVDPLSLDHNDYLKTKLWRKTIRPRVLLRDKYLCRRCSGKADIVHHISYDDDVLLGNNDDGLVSLCDGCHTVVHFASSGKGRTQTDQLAVLTDMSFNEAQPKVDMRRNPFRHPHWDRLTAVQKQTYLQQYNAKK